MSLDHRQHVEAAAIIRRLIQATPTDQLADAHAAGAQWLIENHPSPEAYRAAMRFALESRP